MARHHFPKFSSDNAKHHQFKRRSEPATQRAWLSSTLCDANTLATRAGHSAVGHDPTTGTKRPAFCVRRARNRCVVWTPGFRAARPRAMALRVVTALRAAKAQREQLSVSHRNPHLHLAPAKGRHHPRSDVGVIVAPAHRTVDPIPCNTRNVISPTTSAPRCNPTLGTSVE